LCDVGVGKVFVEDECFVVGPLCFYYCLVIQVLVIGSGFEYEVCVEEVGCLLVECGCIVVIGGFGEVMVVVVCGVKKVGGMMIGIFLGMSCIEVNEWIDYVVVMGIGYVCNLVVVGFGDVVIVVGGSWGILVEIGFVM